MTQYQDHVFTMFLEALEGTDMVRLLARPRVVKYEIVSSSQAGQVQRGVQALINAGWQPHGSLGISDRLYTQAVVKMEIP